MPRWFHRNYLYLVGIVSGIIFAWNLPAWWIMAVGVFILAAFLIWHRAWREIIILSVSMFCGMGSIMWDSMRHVDNVKNEYCRDLLIRIEDSAAYGEVLNEDDRMPYIITVEAVNRQELGRFQLYLPAKISNPGIGDGELWVVSGNFYKFAPPTEVFIADGKGSWQRVNGELLDGYSKYLTSQHFTGRLVVEKIDPVKSASTPQLLNIRRKMAQLLDYGLTDQADRALLGALVLGLRSRLPQYIRNDFAQIGVAHLFSVSGLHVGVLALLLLLVLRPLPKVWHWLLISTLVFYVALTGGNAPAIRAFVMVLTLEFFRAQLLYIKSLELLSLIAGALLLINPHYLTDAGFQYSFVVTALLIMASVPVRDIVRSAGGASFWWGDIPRWKRWLLRWRGAGAGTVIYALVAALGSGVLVLYHQNIFFAGSLLVNILILPILTPLFLLAIGKCLLPWWADFINIPLKWLLAYLKGVVRFACEFTDFNEIARPHWLLVVIFLIALAWLLVMYRQCWSVYVTGIVLVLSLIFIGCGGVRGHSGTFAAVAAGGELEHPVVAVIMPEAHLMYMLNAGSSGAKLISETATCYGITRIGRLDYAYAVTDCSDGTWLLLRNFAVESSRVPDSKIRSKSFLADTQLLAPLPGAQASVLTAPGFGSCKINDLPDGSWELDCGIRGRYQVRRNAFTQLYIIPDR